ncbi:exodeoxyribonuclease VII small subunit [Candidatus Uhrbacteria bacterium]|nr:exodeoxyribonuclease VII small subunit [Candidatus Uhrbacteria bacterium]
MEWCEARVFWTGCRRSFFKSTIGQRGSYLQSYLQHMPKKANPEFSKAFKELEQLAEWFENEEPDLDKGLQKFERAMELAGTCREALAGAEQKITEIKKRFQQEGD